LVGNKSDLYENEEIEDAKVKEFAKVFNYFIK
jgi:hypothetical protein